MSPLRRITYALVISVCAHFLFLVAMSGQWGSRSGPFKSPGLLLVELIRLSSRGAEASVTADTSAFIGKTQEADDDPDAETPPSLNVERRAGEEPAPSVKRSSENQRSTDHNNNLRNMEPERAEPALHSVNNQNENNNQTTGTRGDVNNNEQSDPPLCISCPQPAYPPLALERGLEGEVVLNFQVLPDGSVGDIFVEVSSGYPTLDEAALKSVKSWVYRPAENEAAPAAIVKHKKIRFSLRMP